MSVLSKPVAKRAAALFALHYSTDFEGEERESKAAMKRLLKAEGLSPQDVAIVIANGHGEIEQLKYSDSDAEAIFAKGVEKGRAERNGTASSTQYLNENGEPRWMEIAKFCASSPARVTLKPNEQDVIDKAPSRLRSFGSMTRPTEGFLLSIFWKLGGTFK